MSNVLLEAEARTDMGKGASRRLRRLENKVPGIVYGGEKGAQPVLLPENKVVKALESESIYSSIFDLKVAGKVERVILKDIQRHPYKPIILHMDFQRVSPKDILVKLVPLHFINEEVAPGVKEGGLVHHTMTQVEVRCEARYLPEFIEVDLTDMALDSVLHLSDLKLPKGVSLATDPKAGDHDHPIVSIHLSRVALIEEEAPVAAEAELEQAGETAEEAGEAEGIPTE